MNVPAVLLLLFVIGITLFISERLAKAKWLSVVLARKVVHIVAVTAVAISPAFFSNQLLLGIIVSVFTGILFWAVASNKLAIDEQRQRKSWGIVIFPIAFLVLLALFGNTKPWLVIYPMLVLAWADAVAAIAGETLAKRYFHLTGDRKSWQGSIAFFITTFFILWLLPPMLAQVHPIFEWPHLLQNTGVNGLQVFALWLFVAMVSATAEALGSSGFDNVLVPVVTAWGMQAVVESDAWIHAMVAMALVIPFAILAYWKKWLDAGGAVSAALLGTLVWVVGGMEATAPMLLFFVSGSLLGKLPRRANSDAKHNKPRDWVQVAANGGVGGALLIASTFFPDPAFKIAFFVSVAISTSDTWSSEIGQGAGGTVRDIVDWKPLQSGLSGGVSWQGTMGGLLGAVAIGLCGKWIAGISWTMAMLIAMTGFAGMLVDSVLGSICQARYQLNDGSYIEDRPLASGFISQKGWRWMTNDLVNLLSNVIVTATVLLMMSRG
jgi:uncharacterized protein (TIGR00297 family)